MTEATEHQQDLGIVGRMINTFRAPGTTFAAMKLSHSWRDWLVPTLIVALVTLASGITLMPVMEQFSADLMDQQMQAMSSEQRKTLESMGSDPGEMMQSMQGALQVTGVIFACFLVFIWLVVLAALLLLLSNFILGGNATFSQMLGVCAYASLVGVIQVAIVTPWIIASESLEVYTGLGILLSSAPSTFLSHLVAGVDFFTLWQIVIMAIGMAAIADLDPKRSLTALLVAWGVYVVGKAGLSVLLSSIQSLAAGM